jgi:hypothetical protein
MHLWMVSRGIKHDVDRMITQLQGKYLPFEMDDKSKKMAVQLAVRPIQLWELVFPEPSLQTILNTLAPMNWKREGHFKHLQSAVRLALKGEKVPEADRKTPVLPLYHENIELQLLGIKKDKHKFGYERL